jgi:membrane-associated protease RseP (regulator of RpoE activity)
MGAIIRMRSPMPNRRVIFDVGIAGPLAGLCVALPLTVLGLFLSRIVPQLPEDAGVLQFGEPLLFKVLARLILGPVPEGATILAHPIAFAGWVGFFVTALNLVPAGQLDGGHVTYAMLGRRHDKVALLAVLALFGMTGYTLFSASPNFSWAAIGGLLLSFGYRHPPPLNDLTPLDPWRRRLGVLTCGLFVTLFTPVPIVF